MIPIDCPDDTTTADVARAAARAEDALETAIEAEEVEAAAHLVQLSWRTAACLGERIPPAEAARLHFLDALVAFAHDADPVAARPHLVAMRSAAPEVTPRASLLSPPIAAELAQAAPPDWQMLPVERGVRWVVDGTPASRRPAGLPVLLQAEACTTGEVLRTAWLDADDGPPSVDDLQIPGLRVRHTLVGVTAGLLAGAAASWATAVGTRAAWDGGQETPALRTTNHVALPLSITLAVGGAGTGVAALAIGPACRER